MRKLKEFVRPRKPQARLIHFNHSHDAIPGTSGRAAGLEHYRRCATTQGSGRGCLIFGKNQVPGVCLTMISHGNDWHLGITMDQFAAQLCYQFA
jgi:hypothetical protein